MPKKSSKLIGTVRKTIWKTKSSQRNSKRTSGNNIYIGAGNSSRWIKLKKKLDYKSDIDFVSYLLDLVDSKNSDSSINVSAKKEERNLKEYEENSNDSSISAQCEETNDMWAPTGNNSADIQLRRSPRTPTRTVKAHVRRSARNIATTTSVPEVEPPHEEEEKEKENQDNIKDSSEKIDNLKGPIEKLCETFLCNEKLTTCEVSVVLERHKIVDDINKSSDLNHDHQSLCESNESAVIPTETIISETGESTLEKFIDQQIYNDEVTADSLATSVPVNENASECATSNVINEAENSKPETSKHTKQKRRKRRKSVATHFDYLDESDEGSSKTERKAHFRHKKKKHKHGSKRKHDSRKESLDELAQLEQSVTENSFNDITEITSDFNDTNEENHLQRVAIKIKLCSDCNSRHVQDLCPLQNPLFIVEDSVQLEEWKKQFSVTDINTSESSDVHISSLSNSTIASTNPSVLVSNNIQSTEPNSANETIVQRLPGDNISKSSQNEEDIGDLTDCLPINVKKESPFLENDIISQEDLNEANDFIKSVLSENNEKKTQELTFARASLPAVLQFSDTDSSHGFTIITVCSIQQYTQFGPLIGQPIKEMDIPDDFSMKDIWEVFSDNEHRYLSTSDPELSNWLRYIKPAPSRGLRNIVPVVKEKKLYFVTLVELGPGEELLYWSDDNTTTWSKKKMEKTNCGGCNLKFSHPLYYRMHCTVFHDPNFSLTIRKYHCKVCGTAVLGKENIMKHAAEMHEGKGAYQCQYCKKFFLRLNYLEMHRTYGCASNPQRTRPLCDFCGRKFCQPQKLKVHIKRMHSDMAEVLREFQCKICFKLLGSRAALQRHMKEVHHKDIIGACTCDRCGKMFQNKSNLKIHMLTHSGVKPFKCREQSCAAAFTTKQCLQFHYRKVHSFTEQSMPKIERSVAYTFDAYSGGIVEDPGRGKSPKFSGRRNSTDNNSSSLTSHDDSSSGSSLKADISGTSSTTDGNTAIEDKGINDEPPSLTPPSPPCTSDIPDQQPPTLEAYETETVYNKVIISKGSKKWLGHHACLDHDKTEAQDVYEFDDSREDENLMDFVNNIGIVETAKRKPPAIVFQRPHSSNASLLVEAAIDAAERVIAGTCGIVSSNIQSSSVISSNVSDDTHTVSRYSVANVDARHLINTNTHMVPVSSPVHHSVISPQANEYTLQHAEELMSPTASPDPIHHEQHHLSPKQSPEDLQSLDYEVSRRGTDSPDGTEISVSDHLNHTQLMSSYQLQDQNVSPAHTPDATPVHSHIVDEYSLHQHEDIMSPSDTPDNHHNQVESYGLHSQDELVSPSETPISRYDIHPHLHHHQVPNDNLSSDEGDGIVAQNLSLSLKNKTAHLDLAAAAMAYKQYEALETIQEFGRPVDRFEPLLVGTTPELQGLDMSARSVNYHGFVSGNSRYHHGSVLYDMSSDRQTVDLSIAGRGAYVSSPPPSYSHSDVLRVVTLDLTPGVDLSLSRSHHAHHHHQTTLSSRSLSPSPGTSNHVVPEVSRSSNLVSSIPTTNDQGLIDQSRIMSPSPHPGYQNYPLSPSSYHRSTHVVSTSPSSYHHFSGYY